MQLYEISEQYQNIEELLKDPDFADNPDILDALDKIEDDFNHKVEQTVFILKNLESEIDPIDCEIKRLQTMKKHRQNHIERIKTRLKANLAITGIHKVKCRFFSISYREKAQGAVELNETEFLANNLDETLVNVKITPSKSKIKQALLEGEIIPGAKLVDSQILTIR